MAAGKGIIDKDWSRLRLEDRIRPPLHILFVGINPGVRSALLHHHFAGYSNRFWKLLADSGLTPELLRFEDDIRLPEWGLGLTNLIARPSRGISDLRPAEYLAGWKILERKIRRFQPRVVALVGITLYRAILPLLPAGKDNRSALPRYDGGPGPQELRIHGAAVFVLPNPSGRNAHFNYGEMLHAYESLRRWTEGRARTVR